MRRYLKKARLILSDPHYRYAIVGRQLKGCYSVLDVGGYKDCERWLRKTAPHVKKYVSLNISPAWYGKREFHIKYEGKKIPFEKGSFDAVIFVDSLEHMREGMRLPLIQQAIDIAKRKVVLIFPFLSPENVQFEKEYRDLLKAHNLPMKPAIREHYLFGLPNYQTILNAVKKYSQRIKYVTDRRIFGSYTFAQIIVLALFPKKATRLNALLQREMEKRLLREKNVPKRYAHRVLIAIKKS